MTPPPPSSALIVAIEFRERGLHNLAPSAEQAAPAEAASGTDARADTCVQDRRSHTIRVHTYICIHEEAVNKQKQNGEYVHIESITLATLEGD